MTLQHCFHNADTNTVGFSLTDAEGRIVEIIIIEGEDCDKVELYRKQMLADALMMVVNDGEEITREDIDRIINNIESLPIRVI
jgi:hypothetical protein